MPFPKSKYQHARSHEHNRLALPCPGLRTRAIFGTLSAFALGLSIAAQPRPSFASTLQVRTALAIQNVRLAVPQPFQGVYRSGLLGIDQEPASTRKLLLDQAAKYIALRRGRLNQSQIAKWNQDCENHKEDSGGKTSDENPFCAYERQRRQPGDRNKTGRTFERRLRLLTLANDLKEGNFDKAGESAFLDLVGAVAHLDKTERSLSQLAMRIADERECVAPAISAALGAKLEERFPALEIVELSKRLYRKASSCGNDYAAAQASFRLALIQIWQNDCAPKIEGHVLKESESQQLANRPNDFTNGTPIDTIALMSKVEKTAAANVLHARAKFWRHYCAQKIGDEKNKAEAQQSLFEENPLSFQALATTAEKDSLAEKAKSQETPQVAFRSLVRPELNAILRASEALMRLKENQFAIEILDKNLREIGSIEPEVRVYVAINLNRLEATLPKFKLLAELFQEAPKTLSVATLQLYFPLSYFDLIKKKENKIDPFLILSLIRQESAFNKDARSIAGARGLMQVMPQTARMVARVRAQNLFNPDVNIAVGAKYFMNRLKQYDGDVELTLAAYNAGFMRVDDWKKRYPTDNKILFLDFIPFRETREYVTSILRNYYWYVNLYEDENSGNKNRMPASRATKSETVLTGKKTDISKKNHAIVSGNAGIAAGSIESVTDDAPAVSDGASGSGAAPMEAKDVSTDNLRDKPIKQ